ncbi:MAG: S-layer homology domain-containing protein [Thermoleophilia bacterium]|nr:S-layer homology domain-containing protein [Thermoleophilia bacterium]
MRDEERGARVSRAKARTIVVGLAVFLFLLHSPAARAAYPDVPSDSPYARGIGILSGRGILEGFSDGSFRPDRPVTRAQLAKILVLASGHHPDGRPADSGDTRFPDVTPALGVPYPYDFIEEAASLGFFQGDEEGRFNPDGNVTRLQLALVLVRAAGDRLRLPPSPGYRTDFTDVPDWAAEAVSLARWNGLLEGKSQTVFDPWSAASRGQVAKMVAELPMVRDPFLHTFRLDFTQEDVHIELSGLRERTVPVPGVPVGSRVILGELVLENQGTTVFHYDAQEFSLLLVPDLMGPGERTYLKPTPVDDLPYLGTGDLAPGETIHGYLLTWIAPGGTQTKGVGAYNYLAEIFVD